ncbi:hypothetical protein Ciccas_007468 [Cichlidogyrus casuarinus]|uniref:Uncharacterized protein n=1 Tax=Cichlidogyrus casuarinus TaxID=1844966 RepID=A0ABD2Q3G2_9PLAT
MKYNLFVNKKRVIPELTVPLEPANNQFWDPEILSDCGTEEYYGPFVHDLLHINLEHHQQTRGSESSLTSHVTGGRRPQSCFGLSTTDTNYSERSSPKPQLRPYFNRKSSHCACSDDTVSGPGVRILKRLNRHLNMPDQNPQSNDRTKAFFSATVASDSPLLYTREHNLSNDLDESES